MTEIAVYGLPVRMPHWSFGVRYIHQLVRQSMGHSKIFEVMFPGDPCRAFLMDSNSLAENALVTAHVLGHADFCEEQPALRALPRHGRRQHRRDRPPRTRTASSSPSRRTASSSVEQVLDAALALESHIDVDGELHRSRYPEFVAAQGGAGAEHVPAALQPAARRPRRRRAEDRPGARAGAAAPGVRPALVHRQLRARARAVGARHLPDGARRVVLLLPGVRLPDHERGLGVVLARAAAARGGFPAAAALPVGDQGAFRRGAPVRERPADRARHQSRTTSASPSGSASSRSTASSARARCAREEDDFGFIRNWLDEELAEESGLFVYEARPGDEIRVATKDIAAIREAILAPKFNFGAPRVAAVELKHDGSLTLAARPRQRRPRPRREPREAGARVREPRVAPPGQARHRERARRARRLR